MRAEDTLQFMTDFYPDLFPTRKHCLDHLFCVIGNGYEWIDGELVDKDDEYEKRYKLINPIERATFPVIKPISASLFKWYEPSEQYSYLYNFPDNIKPDWKRLLLETIQYLKQETDFNINVNIHMNIFDLCIKLNLLREEDIEFDEAHNLHIYGLRGKHGGILDLILKDIEYDDYAFIDAETVQHLTSIKIVMDTNSEEEESYILDWEALPCSPYYQMRGKRVSEEQAFDIIRRTDNFFALHSEIKNKVKDLVYISNIDNCLVEKNHIPQGYGWIHRDGVVGINTTTQQYPDFENIFLDMFKLITNFPYLNLVIAITDWDETCKDYFYDSVDIVIQLKENTIRFLSKYKGIELYKYYASQYEEPDSSIYEPDYYEKNNIIQVDKSYFEKILKANGLTIQDIKHNTPIYMKE